MPAEAQRVLSLTIEGGVRKQRLSVVPKGVALAQAPRLADCLEQLDCQDKLTTVNEADYLLTTSIEATGDLSQSDWTLRLKLVEATTGDYAAQLSEPCTRCTADQASTTLDALVAACCAMVHDQAARRLGDPLDPTRCRCAADRAQAGADTVSARHLLSGPTRWWSNRAAANCTP